MKQFCVEDGKVIKLRTAGWRTGPTASRSISTYTTDPKSTPVVLEFTQNPPLHSRNLLPGRQIMLSLRSEVVATVAVLIICTGVAVFQKDLHPDPSDAVQ